MKCNNCGSEIEKGSLFCANCGAKVSTMQSTVKKNSTDEVIKENFEQIVSSTKNIYSQVKDDYKARRNGQQTLNQIYPKDECIRGTNIALSKDEKIVKTYVAADMGSLFSPFYGYLTVTNKRLLFYGSSTMRNIIKEITIDSVSGIDSYFGTSINIIMLLFGLFIVILGSMARDIEILMFILLIIGAFIIYKAFGREFNLVVFSSKSSESPISVSSGTKIPFLKDIAYTLTAKPSTDTKVMMNELGAIIIDLQTNGDYALEKWCE